VVGGSQPGGRPVRRIGRRGLARSCRGSRP
jgi:hypothetical protein